MIYKFIQQIMKEHQKIEFTNTRLQFRKTSK